MRVFQEHPLLRFVNRRRLIRDAVTDFIERGVVEMLKLEKKGNKNERNEGRVRRT